MEGDVLKGGGCHVSCAGGLARAAERGAALGVDTIQVHPTPPQRWNPDPPPEGVEDEYLALREESPVKNVFFHAIYLINLATPDKRNFGLSCRSLASDLAFGVRTGARGVIFHVGSMKDEPDTDAGVRRAAEGIDRILDASPEGCPLLLEVSAGSGTVIGHRFEELASIYEKVKAPGRLGFALDTQHLWASGYRLDGEDLDSLLGFIERTVGLSSVKVVHLNDSKTACGSRVDRHADLGQGTIGHDTLRRVVRDPRLAGVPFVLETPSMKSPETAAAEVAVLRSYMSA